MRVGPSRAERYMQLSGVLAELEAEAVYILRECAGRFDRTAILFSGGKDSIVVAHLARLAFAPAKVPFPLLHVDTGHNFQETLDFRDAFVAKYGFDLVVRYVQDSIDSGRVQEEEGVSRSRNALQTVTLLDAIKELKLDAAIGGARRDEEKARAKERIFSHRNRFGQWDPKSQRPEPWGLFDTRKAHDEHFRVFPLSNWTELDVWRYILARELEVPSLYFSHERPVVWRDSVWLAETEFLVKAPDEVSEVRTVRFRTVGDATCTGAVESKASTLEEIVEEISTVRLTERSTRADDKRSEAAMEDRKRQGYF
ncbi:MAG TPA: sulfate adenylyltransferase subunit CysD [Fimbriimonas sp.]|nr:sulfate adenylyltransferase subunit CysD [Fimbriimonas sp.]